MSTGTETPTRWLHEILRHEFTLRELLVLFYILLQTHDRKPPRPRFLSPNLSLLSGWVGLREDHVGRILRELAMDDNRNNVLVMESHKVKFRGRRYRWTRIGMLDPKHWKRPLRAPSAGGYALDSAEVEALELLFNGLDPDRQDVMEEIVPPRLRDVLLEWNLPMGVAGVLPDANRQGPVEGVATSAAGDEGANSTDIGGPVSSPTGTRPEETPGEIASGVVKRPPEDVHREKTALEKFAEKYPAPSEDPNEVPATAEGAMMVALMVPNSGTSPTVPATAHDTKVPNSGTAKATAATAASSAVPKSGTQPVPNSGTRARAVASSDPDQVQELAKAEESKRAIERMAKLSPDEWLRFSKPVGRFRGWRTIAEDRPGTMNRLLDRLDATIKLGEYPGNKPVMRPLAVLYRLAEEAGLVEKVKRLRAIR